MKKWLTELVKVSIVLTNRLKSIKKPMRKRSSQSELSQRTAGGGIAVKGWMVNGLSRTA